MKYIEKVNALIRDAVANVERPVVFGQNIDAGSCLGGLTRGMKSGPGGVIWNSTNAENSLVGFGFGIMMNGGRAGFFMKQMDFLLLGVDQLVNTYNIIRNVGIQPKTGGFTILAAVVDSGYEGPQSSLNNFADFCSIARVPGFAITNKTDADFLLPKYLLQPGFRIIGVSQRLEKMEIIDPGEPVRIYGDGEIFRYGVGTAITVACFNFAFPYGAEIAKRLSEEGLETTLFTVNAMHSPTWEPIMESVKHTKKLIVIDDSKSMNLPCMKFVAEVRRAVALDLDVVITRTLGENWLQPTSDEMNIDYVEIVNQCKK
jgi:pyruvate/2-oxoglutarate/acetoin dehydrogenase E1 component